MFVNISNFNKNDNKIPSTHTYDFYNSLRDVSKVHKGKDINIFFTKCNTYRRVVGGNYLHEIHSCAKYDVAGSVIRICLRY